MIFSGYGIFAGLILFVAIFAAIPLVLSLLIQPKSPSKDKSSTYECGIQPFGNSRLQFDIKYYLFALLFVVFDVEAVFLLPWAVIFRSLGLLGFIEAVIFIAILFLGLLYAWKKNALKWE